VVSDNKADHGEIQKL